MEVNYGNYSEKEWLLLKRFIVKRGIELGNERLKIREWNRETIKKHDLIKKEEEKFKFLDERLRIIMINEAEEIKETDEMVELVNREILEERRRQMDMKIPV